MVLFQQDTTKSASMVRKNKMAGLDDDYRQSAYWMTLFIVSCLFNR